MTPSYGPLSDHPLGQSHGQHKPVRATLNEPPAFGFFNERAALQARALPSRYCGFAWKVFYRTSMSYVVDTTRVCFFANYLLSLSSLLVRKYLRSGTKDVLLTVFPLFLSESTCILHRHQRCTRIIRSIPGNVYFLFLSSNHLHSSTTRIYPEYNLLFLLSSYPTSICNQRLERCTAVLRSIMKPCSSSLLIHKTICIQRHKRRDAHEV